MHGEGIARESREQTRMGGAGILRNECLNCAMGTRWVTFDCFGTLVDWNAGFHTLLQPIVGRETSNLLRAYHRCEREVESQPPYRLYKEVLATSLDRAAHEIGISLNKVQLNLLSANWAALPLFDDVEEALDALRREDYKLAVLTNCDDDLFAETQRRFRVPFDVVVTAEQVRSYKPSPNHFRQFPRVSSVDRADWIHVACSWYHDIVPARDQGIKRIWIDRDLTGEDPGAASVRLLSAATLPMAVRQLFDGKS
jgi:2-haloacid dehalogenase